jgi:CRISPR-associated exonuclease Cas4
VIYLALALLLVALLLFLLSGRQQRAAGLPGGRVIYTDTRGWGVVEKPLYSPELGLTGKPDYIVEQRGQLIPVEVKSGRIPDAPYDAHIYQLAAYCLLIQHVHGQRPAYGIIHYPGKGESAAANGRSFAVDYTQALEDAVLNLMDELRAHTSQSKVDRSHEAPARCARCGYRGMCDQKL